MDNTTYSDESEFGENETSVDKNTMAILMARVMSNCQSILSSLEQKIQDTISNEMQSVKQQILADILQDPELNNMINQQIKRFILTVVDTEHISTTKLRMQDYQDENQSEEERRNKSPISTVKPEEQPQPQGQLESMQGTLNQLASGQNGGMK